MGYQRHERFISAFGENLRKIRLAKGISQEDLADKADLTLSQVGRIERGVINTSISMVYSLAAALEIEPLELFRFKID
ncbi:helix-turn-helix domain-containing protein [Bacteroidota bacterium]